MKRGIKGSLHCLVACICVCLSSSTFADKRCAYLNDQGEVEQADSPEDAPKRYRSRVICADDPGVNSAIPKAQDVEIRGALKTASFVTDLGPISLKWPYSVEKCFGRSPARAVADAAQTVNRAIASAPFPPEVKNRSREWSLVFTDKDTANREFPASLTIGGHPGFMVPPNNIYLISEFISPSCNASDVGDAMLAQVLLHEMGHVIEFLILGPEFGLDRPRAEGFASWFEQYASDYSKVIPKGSVKAYYRQLATEAMRSLPAPFEGSPYDYARAALQFDAIVGRRGVAGLMGVYSVIKSEGVPFHTAVERSIRWNKKTLEQEMIQALK
jgi:hypothetical protein